MLTSPGWRARIHVSVHFPPRLLSSRAICLRAWFNALLLAAYAAYPSSWPRKLPAEPESDEMKMTFEGGLSGLRLISFWAQIIGPMVLVVR